MASTPWTVVSGAICLANLIILKGFIKITHPNIQYNDILYERSNANIASSSIFLFIQLKIWPRLMTRSGAFQLLSKGGRIMQADFQSNKSQRSHFPLRAKWKLTAQASGRFLSGQVM